MPLGREGIEEIITAIVSQNKDNPAWQSEIAPRSMVFDKLVTECNRMKLFSGMKGPEIRERIIESIYPMHPVATHALIQLAIDVASNNRSVYTFFGGGVGDDAVPGSFGQYIATTPILSDGKLNLYTADLLYDYFAVRLRSDNREIRENIREFIKDYESSIRELRRVAEASVMAKLEFLHDPLIPRIMRLMLIYDIILIPTTLANLLAGLNCTTQAEKAEVENRLLELSNKSILYYAKETHVYEFKKSSAVDLDRLIEQYKQNSANIPTNIAAELSYLAPLGKNEEYLEAKDYNIQFSEDKRLKRRIVRAVDLGSESDAAGGKGFFAALEAQLSHDVTKPGDYEGIALYVVCETQEEIKLARNFSTKNESHRIVVAIPRQPIPMLDALMDLNALVYIKQSPEAANFTMQDNSALEARLRGERNKPGAIDAVRALRDKLFSSKEVTWYGQYGAVLPTEDTKPYDPANRVMEQLYSAYQNRFSHDDFNKLHNKVDHNKSSSLKETVEEILDYTQPIIIDTSFAQNRGDRRYLEKCLLQNGVLTQVGKSETRLRCNFTPDPAKYASKLPTLAEMVREIGSLQSGQKLRLTDWVSMYRRPPYGQGPISLAISLASIIRIFGDSIRIKQDEQMVGDMRVASLEDVLDLVDGHYANAFLSYRELRGDEKALVRIVYDLFGQPASAEVREYSLAEAVSAMKDWWSKLPPVARVAALYPSGKHPYSADFIDVMQKIEARDAHTFLLDDLPTAFGFDAGLAVNKETLETLRTYLPQQQATLEFALTSLEFRIMAEVRSIFGVQGNTYGDIVDAIRAWYNSLDTNQRDQFAKWQNNDSKPLSVLLKSVDAPQETFLVSIPKTPEYGGKAVRDWIVDQVPTYVARLSAGKERIDANRLKVEGPALQIKGQYTRAEGGPVLFKDLISLAFSHSDPNASIYLSEDGADPTSPGASRVQIDGVEPIQISGHKTIKVAAQDPDGNWSQIETIQFFNEHKKYEIKLPLQKAMQDEVVSFVFPSDPEGFEVAARSLFKLALERSVLTVEQLADQLENVVAGLKSGVK